MTNILSLFDINFSIRQAFRTLSCSIAALIYSFIDYIYDIFIYISKAEILNSDFVQSIYRKVGLILGIFMLFKLTFSLIQALIAPEKLNDKKSGFGAIISRCIISIVLLGITPTIFREAFNIQNMIIGNDGQDNVIYKLIVGDTLMEDINDFGRKMSSDLFFSFYTDYDDPFLNNGSSEYNEDIPERYAKDDYDNLKNAVETGDKSFYDTIDYLSIKSQEKYVIEYNEILSIAIGGIVAYMLILYCIQVAIRCIQLGYLQLIAPIPILSYISDPEGSFKKWIKQCTTTFLDLFIRLAIIYFIIYLSGYIIDQLNPNNLHSSIMTSTGLDPKEHFTIALVKVFIIIGLFLFAKRVPELLKDLFPGMGGGVASLSMGLKSPKKLWQEDLSKIPIAGGTIGWLGKQTGKGLQWTGKKISKPITTRFNNWKEDRKNKEEIRALEGPGKHLYDRYGKNIENAFSSEEYKQSFLALKQAKDDFKDISNEYEVAKSNGTLNAELEARYRDAEKRVKDTTTTHDNNRKRYGSDARKEDAFNMYKSLNPNKFSSPSPTSRPQSQPVTQSGHQTQPQPQPVTQSGHQTQPQPVPQQQTQNNSTSSPNISTTSAFGRVTRANEDDNPYESDHSQFTADAISENINDDNPYENPNYYNDNSNSRNSSNSNLEDDNPYTNPNYYNDNSQASNNNDDDEFDGSNYY